MAHRRYAPYNPETDGKCEAMFTHTLTLEEYKLKEKRKKEKEKENEKAKPSYKPSNTMGRARRI